MLKLANRHLVANRIPEARFQFLHGTVHPLGWYRGFETHPGQPQLPLALAVEGEVWICGHSASNGLASCINHQEYEHMQAC
jgi:hypothetical protein